MELRAYGRILWRRLWIVALVVGVVTIYVAYQYFGTSRTAETRTTYHATVDMRIGVINAQTDNSTQYISASESMANELATGPILTSPGFLERVIQQIEADQATINARFGENADLGTLKVPEIEKSLKVEAAHSTVSIDVDWNTEAGAWAIAYGIGKVSENELSTFMSLKLNGQTTNEAGELSAVARMINEPADPTSSASAVVTRKNTTLLLLLLVGLIIGLALAFLVEYLDDRMHEPAKVEEALQLPIYGEVPRAPVPGRPVQPNASTT